MDNLKNDISQYHENIAGSTAITQHTSIYHIYTNVITNPDFKIDGDSDTNKVKCEQIKAIQSHMNNMDVESDNYKTFKTQKNKIKGSLGGCYYQKYKPLIKKGEVDNTYTGYLVIDVDEYDIDYSTLKENLRINRNVVMYFTSPSGGLKIIVATDLQEELNPAVYQECYIKTFNSLDTGIEFDVTAKNNNDLICFYAYDSDAYYNPDFIKYECYEEAVKQVELDKIAKAESDKKKVTPLSSNIKDTGRYAATINNGDTEYTDDEIEEIYTLAKTGYDLEGKDDYDTWQKFNYALYALLKDNYLVVALDMFGEDQRHNLEGFYKSGCDGVNAITIGSLIRYAKIGGYVAKRKNSDTHKFNNVIDMTRAEQLLLKKPDLTKDDINHPAPNEIYPNYSITYKTDRNGEEHEEFKKRKSNDNLYALAAYLGIDLSFDVIKGVKIGVIPFYEQYNGSNDEEILHNDLEDILTINDFPEKKVTHLLRLHHSNSFNALTDMCKGAAWDGVDRIKALKDCLVLQDGYDEWLDIAMDKWLVQCCAAWDNARNTPNTNARATFDSVLIFTGGQGINKTSFFEGLLPDEVSEYFKSGLHLDPTKPDSVRQATSFGMVELGEIDTTFTQSAISLLKAFLSNSYDKYREAYAKKDTHKERRTSYCGSVNGASFLRDLTGNRRYYPIALQDIDFDTYTEIDKNQLWAQVWKLYSEGKTWWLDKDSNEAKLHEKILELHMEADPILDELKKSYDFTIINDTDRGIGWTSKQLLENIDLPNDQKTVRHLNKMLEGLGFISKRKKNSSNVWYLTAHHHVNPRLTNTNKLMKVVA